MENAPLLVTLNASPTRTRLLAMDGSRELMRAVLGPVHSSDRLAAAMLLEGLALWHRRPLSVALCVGERDGSSSAHLFGAFQMASPALDYTVGVVLHDPPGTDPAGKGLGPFGDLRSVCRGLR